MKQSARKALPLAMAAVVIAAAILLAAPLASELGAEARYEGLRDAGGPSAAHADDNDYMSPRSRGYVGWLSLDGTGIDYPVAQPEEDMDPEFYLTHDLWGEPSPAGCPYLDRRCSPLGDHLMVLAHRMGFTGKMFSPIHDSYDQRRFDRIGRATWVDADGVETAFEPLMAMRVNERYEPIQHFGWEDEDAMRGWLAALADDASARRSGAESAIARADRVLTLVTCSGAEPGGDGRTLLILTSEDAGRKEATDG